MAGELMREAEKLIAQKIHPQTIIAGWRLAEKAARKALEDSAVDNGKDEKKFKEDLLNIARTTLSSKILHMGKDHFATLAVEVALRLGTTGALENVHILKKSGGQITDSYLVDGLILEKKIGVGQPKRFENPKIMVANTPMDTDKIKIFGTRVRVDSTAQLAEIENAEKAKMLEKCKKIVDHGINVFVNRQLVYNLAEQYFTEKGVICIEHADFDGVERLSLVTGADILSTFDDHETSNVKFGTCKLLEEVIIGEDKYVAFRGCPLTTACTVVMRGATQQVLDEAQRSLHDALCVLVSTVKESRTVLGAGCSEMIMAKAVEEEAKKTPGKKAIAMEAFARALRMIPTILADNGGYDSAELVSQLRAAHYKGEVDMGLNMQDGSITNVRDLKITESFKVKRQVLLSSVEAASMLLRVDNIIRSAPRQRTQ